MQGFRACLGILRLSKGHAATEFEAAADYALTIGAHSYGSLQSILKNKRYRRAPDRPAEEPAITPPTFVAPEVRHLPLARLWRDADYFH